MTEVWTLEQLQEALDYKKKQGPLTPTSEGYYQGVIDTLKSLIEVLQENRLH